MGIWRRAPVVAALVAAALLTSCSDEQPGPAETTPAPTTPASSAAPSATPPPTPAVATADVKGAEAFVRYFWDVFNYTYASGDTTKLKSISADTCGFCKSVADNVELVRTRGGRTDGGSVRVDQVLAVPPEIGQGAILTILIDQEAGRSTAKDGEVIGTSEAVSNRVVEFVLKHDARWLVYGIDIKKKGET